jgi:hypothetical protein
MCFLYKESVTGPHFVSSAEFISVTTQKIYVKFGPERRY